MRTLNSLKNVLSNFAYSIFLNILRFVSRIIFVKVLGEVYLGVNGLLSNVLGLLALSELGISTAISYSLYKPLEEKDTKKIKALMNFYKKAYFVISMVVLVSGLILLPFLPWFIKDTTEIEHLNVIYLLFLANMVIGYLFSYKRTLITADQQAYKITPFLMLSSFLTTVFQIIVLLIFKNFIIYLIVQTVFILFENIVVNRYINKQYKYLSEITKEDKLDKEELKSISTGIKALMTHKIGSYVFTSTDNLVISKFVGIVAVGLYSNYVLIVGMVNSFIGTLTNNVIASVGNLIAGKDIEKKYEVFNEMNLICFVLYGVSTLFFISLFQPAISLFFGDKFLLSIAVVLLISYNNYIFGMTTVSTTFATAAGLYYKDRYVPIIQSIVNLVISVLLAIKIGVAGVLIGTLISNVLPLLVKPYIAFKYVFKREFKEYIIDFIKKTSLLFLMFGLVFLAIKFVKIDNLILLLIYRFIVTGVISVVVLFIAYRKNEYFISLMGRIKYILTKKKES